MCMFGPNEQNLKKVISGQIGQVKFHVKLGVRAHLLPVHHFPQLKTIACVLVYQRDISRKFYIFLIKLKLKIFYTLKRRDFFLLSGPFLILNTNIANFDFLKRKKVY